MSDLFGPDFFKGNREKLRELFAGTAPIVITANGLLQRSGDTTYPFRQDSNFWYLTGINEPDVILVLDKEKEYLIMPERDETREIFDGKVSASDLGKVAGIKNVYSEKEGWEKLKDRLTRAKHFAGLTPLKYDISHGFYPNPAREHLLNKITALNPKIKLIDLRHTLADMRTLKQPQEIAAIQNAIDITAKTFNKLQKNKLKSFKTEKEIEIFLGNEFAKNSAGHAYQPIVAAGINACTLHYTQNRARLKKSHLLLIDAGAETSHYAADITRVFPVGKPTRRQQAVHKAVLEIQAYALALLKPTVTMKNYEKQVRQFVGEKLRELGLIKTISAESVAKYYPHSTSHFLGLDVHDVGDYSKPLKSGTVLTVEPGIYIRAEGIGVRIEDNVLITNEGIEILSQKLTKAL